MIYPPVPSVGTIADHFLRSLRQAKREDQPYRHWKMKDLLPVDVCTGFLVLPIAPAVVPDRDGTRDTYNDTRTFITPQLRNDFPICDALANMLRRPDVARGLADAFSIDPRGSFVRVEYIQDVDGCWLEPHRDICEKLFSMVVYLCTGPEAKTWGTDIYDSDRKWIGQAAADFNTAVTFIAGPNTWHGFEKRPIRGVRRLMEINYVVDWRDRQQLAFPGRPIVLS